MTRTASRISVIRHRCSESHVHLLRLRRSAWLAFGIFCALAVISCAAPSLHKHAQRGNLDQVKSLVQQGQNPNVRDANGDTPLHRAAWKGHGEIVQWLLNNGARANIKGNMEQTPLHLAASFGRTEIAKRLVEAGADVNARMTDGRTPLYRAVRSERIEPPDKISIVKFLLSEGADPTIANAKGETPLSLVKSAKFKTTFDISTARELQDILRKTSTEPQGGQEHEGVDLTQ